MGNAVLCSLVAACFTERIPLPQTRTSDTLDCQREDEME